MTVVKGDYQSVFAAGLWITQGSAPSEPTLSIVNDGDGDAVTATVDGDAGATNTLYYRKLAATAWTEGSSRSGDGEIAQSGLDDNTVYAFVCVSSSGLYYSLPSDVVRIRVTSGTVRTFNIVSIQNLAERGTEMVVICTEGD